MFDKIDYKCIRLIFPTFSFWQGRQVHCELNTLLKKFKFKIFSGHEICI